jgi:hypothetical protein
MSKRGEVLGSKGSFSIGRAVTAGLSRSGGPGQLGRFALLRAGEGEDGHSHSTGRVPKLAGRGKPER